MVRRILFVACTALAVPACETPPQMSDNWNQYRSGGDRGTSTPPASRPSSPSDWDAAPSADRPAKLQPPVPPAPDDFGRPLKN